MILIIDDNIGIRTSLTMMLQRAHYEPMAVATPKEAISIVKEQAPQLILMDMNFSFSTSGDEGITLLRQVKLFQPDVPVILMTAWGSIQLAVEGMRAGAFDFITKPWKNVVLMDRIETALQFSKATTAKMQLNTDENSNESWKEHIIGKSPALLQVLDTIRRVAPTNASVLITGESGTGKELIAEALHRNSKRSKENFVKVNLGGMSRSLFESEMFGYRKGAFTGAIADRIGRFGLADKGTIFLDEIGDLDIASQVKLLRVLQDQTFEPLGDSRPRQVNVRVVCATNADLQQMIREKTFREDLFYRINLITVHLPALRERKEDIPLLANYFLKQQYSANQLPPATITDEALLFLKGQAFPGNVRQLKNLVERTLLISGKQKLDVKDFQRQMEMEPQKVSSSSTQSTTLEEQERASIERALKQFDGNISKVAAVLGISRGALYRRLEKYGIEP